MNAVAPLASEKVPTANPASSRLALAGAALLVFACWLGMRSVFFHGLCGSADDIEHVEYALRFDHIPENHWQTRLFYNALLHLAVRCLGPSEFAYALPSLGA